MAGMAMGWEGGLTSMDKCRRDRHTGELTGVWIKVQARGVSEYDRAETAGAMETWEVWDDER